MASHSVETCAVALDAHTVMTVESLSERSTVSVLTPHAVRLYVRHSRKASYLPKNDLWLNNLRLNYHLRPWLLVNYLGLLLKDHLRCLLIDNLGPLLVHNLWLLLIDNLWLLLVDNLWLLVLLLDWWLLLIVDGSLLLRVLLLLRILGLLLLLGILVIHY